MARWGNRAAEVISMLRQQLVLALVRGASSPGLPGEALIGSAKEPFALPKGARTMSHKSADIKTGGASHE